jgi:putative membrane protein
MIKLIANWVLNAIALNIVAYFVPGVFIRDFKAALFAIIVISLLNTVVKPIIILLTLPVTVITLGLFIFVINAILLLIAGSITPGFEVNGFGTAIIGSILFTVVTMVFNRLVK